jgi:hypothetical protein
MEETDLEYEFVNIKQIQTLLPDARTYEYDSFIILLNKHLITEEEAYPGIGYLKDAKALTFIRRKLMEDGRSFYCWTYGHIIIK